jgi:hypothetical protein
MDGTYLSLFVFLITTILYYYVKPTLTLDILEGTTLNSAVPMGTVVAIDDKPYQEGFPAELTPSAPPMDLKGGGTKEEKENAYADFTKSSYTYLIFYVLFIILSQFFINVGIIINKCGGNYQDNFASAAMITIVPWIFIFGSVVLILIAFPGFKSAFSNVVGYFSVSGKASDILNKLLVNTEMNNAVESSGLSGEAKKELQESAEAIIKLCGNTSLMINQIVPDNFESYWNILIPLMKPEFSNDKDLKKQLLDIVVTRDNIGEAMWYCYTAIFLVSIVQYNLTSRGCIMDSAAMVENHQKFVDQEEAEHKNASTQVFSG